MTKAEALAPDLDAVVERNEDDFATFKGARFFITGGTGFVGSWILETLAWANRRLELGASAVVLTRSPDAFASAAPHLLCDPAISFRRGDLRGSTSIWGSFDAVIHAATTASTSFRENDPLRMVETIVDGTRRVLELARRNGAIPFLFTSSGAVYGEQPSDLERVEEGYLGGPDPLETKFAYHESKRLAEMLCAIDAASSALQVKIARLFTLVGPYLPLDRHFEIGNFIGDVLRGRAIDVANGGTAVRTYLYAADVATWLWGILARGETSRAYNVGSERTMSVAEAARIVAAANGGVNEVVIRATRAEHPLKPGRYVPSTQRARGELGLAETVELDEAVRRTIAWHRAKAALR
ncbi:MAG: NAD-dependent epimerase/dehydratase family protein [Candidatus Baltobacteraceae bacterium]|jgi:dTDP-glucose 4,6-dehydratase